VIGGVPLQRGEVTKKKKKAFPATGGRKRRGGGGGKSLQMIGPLAAHNQGNRPATSPATVRKRKRVGPRRQAKKKRKAPPAPLIEKGEREEKKVSSASPCRERKKK